MRVLVVGGSGYVAGLVLPMLARRHTIRVLDRRPPPHEVEYVAGSAVDYGGLREAAEGMDAVVHCAMGSTSRPGGWTSRYPRTPPTPTG
ncbi:MAG: hypothetical protein AUI14_02120 [Actinobacteria bacterium 13_2_20CM_2_71_6]|nr:MAG: hypothetical protein AUI14_02120 [Actinobacteria bacterium 13_2_20CM_2_71_6]